MTKRKTAQALAVIMLVICMAMPTFAITESKDGLEITLETDKDSYSLDEEVKISVSVKNIGDKTLNNISVDMNIPDGVKLAEGSVTKLTISNLDIGETNIHEIKAEAAKDLSTDENVNTGDTAGTIIFITIMCAIAAAVIIAGVKNKKFKKGLTLMSMIVVLCGVFAMITYASVMQFEVSKTITIDGKEKILSVVVSAGQDEETQETTNVSETDTTEKNTTGEPEAANPDEIGVKWEVSGDTLHIYGKGDMDDYERKYDNDTSGIGSSPTENSAYYTNSPWWSQKENIKNIVIDEGITSIGNYAFYYCSFLNEITIPNSVTSIGEGAFGGCSSLCEISMPNSMTNIGYHAFRDCSSLREISIPDGVTSIRHSAFSGCSNLSEISIPDSVTFIDMFAFLNCSSLSEISIPNSVIGISICAFRGCNSLCKISIPDSVTDIGEGAFSDCNSLYEITIPDSVTFIDVNVFPNCSTIYGNAGSYVETYANENGYTFIAK